MDKEKLYDIYVELNNLTYRQLEELKTQARLVKELAEVLGIEDGDTLEIDRKGDY